MLREVFITWLLTIMTSLSPPHRTHFEPAAQESYAQADARYREVAETITDGSFAGDVTPVYGGRYGRQQTAVLVVVWWHAESGFRRDVDLGLARARLAKSGWNDFGRSWCMGQINLGRKSMPDPSNPGMMIEDSPAATPEGWTGKDLCSDRSKCFRATVRTMRQSFSACRALPVSERLAVYASGTCTSEDGRRLSRTRMRQFHSWFAKGRPQFTDEDMLAELKKTQEEAPAPSASVPPAPVVASQP